ncbi:MAG: aquaporin [Dehalococcoidia bacterium]|nr:aquaporin [Dehalococcoidia bacterium]
MIKPNLEHLRMSAGETVGTYLLVLFGTGSVAAAVITGAQVGLWQVAAVWGFGIALAIYATAALSGAHLNPAVSLAFAIFRPKEFPVSRLPLYWVSQMAGGVMAGATIWWLFGNFISRFEATNGLVRGEPGSQHSAMVFGEYFPNPDVFGTGASAQDLISPAGAMVVEAFGTGVLVLLIFSLVDKRAGGLSPGRLAPLFIGFAVAILISLFAPLTQGGWNPARDFGPRLVALAAGWGSIAIPGPQNGFWVYIVGPLIGGPLGAAVHEILLRRGPREAVEAS